MKRTHAANKRWRWLIGCSVALLFALLPLTAATAADVRNDETVIIGADEVVNDDLYAFGSTVMIDGTIKGDLITGASQVTVNGIVEGDIMAAAQTVVINGTVGESIRTAGAVIRIGPQAHIGKDLVAAGSSIETQTGSSVAGDAMLGAVQALLAGQIGKDVKGGFERLELRGSVAGDVNVTVGRADSTTLPRQFFDNGTVATPSVPPGLTVDNTAHIGGKLLYQAPQEATIDHAAQVGGVAPTIQPVAQPTPVNPFVAMMRHLGALLLIGLLLMWVIPRAIERLASRVEARPLPILGWGALSGIALAIVILIVVPAAATMLAVLFGMLTLGRLVLLVIGVGVLIDALLATGFMVAASYLAQTVVGYEAGRWLLQRFQPAWNENIFAPLVLGIVLYVLLAAIPVLGSLVALLVALLGLGAAFTWLIERFGRAPAASAPMRPLQPAGT